MRVCTVLVFTLALFAVSTVGAQPDDNYNLTLDAASDSVAGGADVDIDAIRSGERSK